MYIKLSKYNKYKEEGCVPVGGVPPVEGFYHCERLLLLLLDWKKIKSKSNKSVAVGLFYLQKEYKSLPFPSML